MIRTLAPAVALLLLTPACKGEAEEALPPQEAPVAEPPAAPKPAEAPTTPAPERRERAGIETGDAPEVARDRPPAARLVRAPEDLVPPIRTGSDVATAKAARNFLATTWLRALQTSDADAFQAVLSEQFRARDPKEGGGEVGAADWASKRRPAPGGETKVAFSRARVSVPDEDPPRATLRYYEEARGPEGCVATERALEVVREAEGEGGWRVMSEEALSRSECPEAQEPAIAAAHQTLAEAVSGEDSDAITERVAEQIVVWDEGVVAASYTREDLLKGDGRWLLEAVGDVQAGDEQTHAVAHVGWVDGPLGAFVYELGEGGARLVGLARHLPQDTK